MKKAETRSKRITGRVHPSFYKKFAKFCAGKKWSESVAIEEAIIQMIER